MESAVHGMGEYVHATAAVPRAVRTESASEHGEHAGVNSNTKSKIKKTTFN